MLKDDMTILTPTEVQDYLMVGKNEVYRLLGEGEIKGFRMGRTWKIPVKAVDEYIDKRMEERRK